MIFLALRKPLGVLLHTVNSWSEIEEPDMRTRSERYGVGSVFRGIVAGGVSEAL